MDLRSRPGGDDYRQPASSPASYDHDASVSGGSKRLLVMLLMVATVLLILYLAVKLVGTTSFVGDSAVKSSEYQALFLTNGQVYFGKLSHVDSNYVQLTDIYYLQVQQQVQPKNSSSTQPTQVSLAKLGSELHGPEDQMFVAQSQVLFWENLKTSGKVTQAIVAYQNAHPGTK